MHYSWNYINHTENNQKQERTSWTHNPFVCLVFNATLNNISVISWRSVLLVEETGGPGENYWPVASHWQILSHNAVHLTLIEIRTHNTSGDPTTIQLRPRHPPLITRCLLRCPNVDVRLDMSCLFISLPCSLQVEDSNCEYLSSLLLNMYKIYNTRYMEQYKNPNYDIPALVV